MFQIFKKIFGFDNSVITTAIREGAFLVDVRSPAEFSTGSVSGSVNIPLDKIDAHLEEFKGKQHIIVFCRSGNRSAQAKRILEKNGLQNIMNAGSWYQVNKIKRSVQL
jgi:phage shock protein E